MNVAGLLKSTVKVSLAIVAFSFLFAACNKHNCPAYGNTSKKSFKKYKASVQTIKMEEDKA